MKLFGPPTVEFCEKAGLGLIKRPFYAISNLAYVGVGLFILRKGTRYSRTFGYTSIFIGLASTWYDVSNHYLSQLVDLFAMLVFINAVLFLSVKRVFQISSSKIVFTQVFFIFLGMALIFYFRSFSGGFVFGALVILEILLELFLWLKGKAQDIKYWLWGLALFALGFIVWLLDAVFKICDPTDIVNGRGVYHILTAGTIYLLYKYFEKQEIVSD